jgi:hypothetical protein
MRAKDGTVTVMCPLTGENCGGRTCPLYGHCLPGYWLRRIWMRMNDDTDVY